MNRIPTRPHRWQVVTVFQLLFGLFLSMSALGQPAFLTNGLVAYYPFNGNANDESGNANNGIVLGARLSTDRFGKPDASYRCNGNERGIIVPNFPVSGNGISISFWYKCATVDYARGMRFISHNWDGEKPYGAFGIDSLFGGIFRGTQDSDVLGCYLQRPIPTNTWQHFLITCNGKAATVYTNGVLAASKAGSIALRQVKSTLYIGGDFYFLDGEIDDVRVYNRAMLTNDVQALYAYESTPPDNSFITNGLVAYYPFNGNANDESGNGNNPDLVTADFLQDRFDSTSSAANFNGSQIIRIPDRPKIGELLTNKITISLWVKRTDNALRHILGKRYGSAMWQVVSRGNSSFVYTIKNNFEFETGLSSWDVGKWTHFAVTYNGVEACIYIDGVQTAIKNLNGYTDNTSGIPLLIGGSDVFSKFNGSVDDVRIYNRSLSSAEVKALYDYESTPPAKSLNPRIATATAQVVNGFVVGATITDGGYGYVENPFVTITGGGGTGARGTATQFNGVVTSITITNPGSGYTSAPTITIAPPPFPPRKATANPQVVNGFVVGTTINDGGFGYDTPPAVLVVGGGGSGATAVATVANGVVTAITITNPGTGYTSSPLIRIASPPFAPKLGIETSKVYVRMSVVLGRKYQLEASTDLNIWTATGPAFIAQDEELVQEFDVNQVGRYFRINQVP